MDKNRLSIIIPAYNERKRIPPLIEFLVLNGANCDLEIIIVNAKHSTDDIDELELPKCARIISGETTNRATQLQLGADQSTGDILYFLHADTFPPKNYANQILKSLIKYDIGMFNYTFDIKKWNLRFNGWMTQWKGFYTGGGDQGLFLKRKNFFLAGGFDCKLTIMEDYDLFWRLKKQRLSYKIVKGPAIVSARKYNKNRGIKVNMVNLVTLIGFKLTRNNAKWTAFYQRHIQ